VLAASRDGRPGKFEVLSDNQTTVDIFVIESLLSYICEADVPNTIEGIGRMIYTNLIGD